MAKKVFGLRTIFQERNQLQQKLRRYEQGWPPGHFYSPIPSVEEVQSNEEFFERINQTIPGIDLNEEQQIQLFHEIKSFSKDLPFESSKKEPARYFFDNPNYTYGEAIILCCLIRHVKPRRIVEIGSGYSSCAILDINEKFFNNAIESTFIEPYPQLLQTLIRDDDLERIKIVDKKVQDVDTNIFTQLQAGDILFVDSSHVSKVNSDVNFIFFEVLPRLHKGVYVHFHDIGYPFEYPKEWIYEGRFWNEAYLLRAFLQFNSAFRIRFFNSFMARFYEELFLNEMPLFLKNPGTSIWIERL